MSEVVNTIKKQLVGLGVNLKKRYLVKIDDKTLRVHTPGKKLGMGGGQSVDIKYNKGSDLYDISVHTIGDDLKVKTCRSTRGVYFDSLPNYFNKKVIKHMKCEKAK